MVTQIQPAAIDRERLRADVCAKYTAVAETPEQGFHFHTGRPLARLLGYPDAWIDALPAGAVESFAGTGNPVEFGPSVRPVPRAMGRVWSRTRIAGQAGGAGKNALVTLLTR